MELGSVVNLASRLLAALEKTGVSSGAELRSDFGPSGQPDPELVRAFEEALERAPDSISPGAFGSGEAAFRADAQTPTNEIQPTGTEFRVDRVLENPEALDVPEAPGRITDQSESLRTAGADDFGLRETPQAEISPQAGSEAGDGLRELDNILGHMKSGQLRAEDLFRMQYLVGMLKVHTESGLKASQKTTQGFDNLLRQKG